MSNFVPTENALGIQPIAVSSTTQNHPLGTIVRAFDATLGGAEFIYLEGVVGTVVGSIVTYDPSSTATVLLPTTGTKNLAQPVAVAMSANVATQFGWYQIAGVAVIKKTAVKVSPSVPVFQSGTAGRIAPTAVSGAEILNARSTNTATVASATSTVNVLINRPFAQGQAI